MNTATLANGQAFQQPATAIPLDRHQRREFATSLLGALAISVSAQFVGSNLADIQGGIGSSADEASWITTIYTMTSMAGIIASGPLIRTLGLGRFTIASALLYAATALLCAAAPSLAAMIVLRGVQGFAGGGFGPAAFVAVFTIMTGARRPLGLTLLSFVLVFPTFVGPMISGIVEDRFGWSTLFLIQAAIGGTLALAAIRWMPRTAINREGLAVDWLAISLLVIGIAAMLLVFSQGTRRFWFDNDMIVWATAISASAIGGFAAASWRSRQPVMHHPKLLERTFGLAILLNFLFRIGFAIPAFLIPQFLVIVQGYRPLELSWLYAWAVLPQLAALPLAWWLMHRMDGRLVMAGGLALCAVGAALVARNTGLASADQFRWTLVLLGIGEVLFLAPNLVTGGGPLKPHELPTASIAFNVSTLGGTTIGVGLATHLAIEREKFHSNVLTEQITLANPVIAARLSGLGDGALGPARALASLTAAIRREAWVLALNDAFLVFAGLSMVSLLALLAIERLRPLKPL